MRFPLFPRRPEETPPALTRNAPPALWRRASFHVHPLGEHVHAVEMTHGPACILPSFAVEFALGCDEFKPLEIHVADYAEKHGWDGLQVEALRGQLAEMAKAGVLISTAELEKRCSAMRDAANHPPRIETIGIPTGGDRASLLDRAVRSFATNLRKHEREAKFLVADNSVRPEQRQSWRTLIAQLRSETGCRIFFAGQEEKRSFADRLVQAGDLSPEVIDFAFFDPLGIGFSCGANRNALLVECAGQMFGSVDDDVVCKLAASPEETPAQIAFSSGTDPFSRWLYPDRETALEDARWIDADYLALHEALLGRDVGEICKKPLGEARVDFSESGDGLLARMESDAGRVRATFTGHIGDPGIPTSAYYLYYDGENRRRLVQSKAHYDSVFGSRSVLSVVSRKTIGDASVSPGMAMALDHRELLPPCFPVLHAEDFSYGAALWQCCPGAFLGHLPMAAYHEPGLGKPILLPHELSAAKRVVIFEFAHLLRSSMLHFEPPEHASAADRLLALGRFLEEPAMLPPRDFAEYLRRQALDHASARSEFLAKHLEEFEDAPDYWQADVHALIDHIRHAVAQDDAGIPLDLKTGHPLEETRELMRELFRRYALLLQEWPAIIEAARALHAREEWMFRDGDRTDVT